MQSPNTPRRQILQRAFEQPELRPGDVPSPDRIFPFQHRFHRRDRAAAEPERPAPIHPWIGGSADASNFVSGMGMLDKLRIQSDMDPARIANTVVIIMKIISRMPPTIRHQLEATVLEDIPWSGLAGREDIERDDACCICHDDVGRVLRPPSHAHEQYLAPSMVTVTPCKHMYHQGCLKVKMDICSSADHRRGCKIPITRPVPCVGGI